MRNLLVSSDAIAQNAGNAALSLGGNAVDAVLSALLAGATLASPASLLGSAVITVAGLGVGAYSVDGRARAPGIRLQRRSAPEDPPVRDSIAAPGLVEGVLTAHNRFGAIAIAKVARAATDAIKEGNEDPLVKARLPVLEAIHRHGPHWLNKLGLSQALLEAAGTPVNGVLSRDDLVSTPAPIAELMPRGMGGNELLVVAPTVPPRFAPPTPPATPIGVAIAADMHGVMATAVWAVAPEACLIDSPYALSGAALNNAPTKGVTRRAAGTRIPMPVPVVTVRADARVWAAAAVAGEGALESARDELVARRIAALTGQSIPPPDVGAVRAQSYWLVRDAGEELRVIEESISR
ncbi:MAG: hypothetical protein U0269_24910 [Polyangiales bacterium]